MKTIFYFLICLVLASECYSQTIEPAYCGTTDLNNNLQSQPVNIFPSPLGKNFKMAVLYFNRADDTFRITTNLQTQELTSCEMF